MNEDYVSKKGGLEHFWNTETGKGEREIRKREERREDIIVTANLFANKTEGRKERRGCGDIVLLYCPFVQI